MNSYQTMNAAYAAAGLTKQQAVSDGRSFEAWADVLGTKEVVGTIREGRLVRTPRHRRSLGELLAQRIAENLDAEMVRHAEPPSHPYPAEPQPMRDQTEDRPVRYMVAGFEHREHGLVYYVQNRLGYRITTYTRDAGVANEWALLREQGYGSRLFPEAIVDSNWVNEDTTVAAVRDIRERFLDRRGL